MRPACLPAILLSRWALAWRNHCHFTSALVFARDLYAWPLLKHSTLVASRSGAVLTLGQTWTSVDENLAFTLPSRIIWNPSGKTCQSRWASHGPLAEPSSRRLAGFFPCVEAKLTSQCLWRNPTAWGPVAVNRRQKSMSARSSLPKNVPSYFVIMVWAGHADEASRGMPADTAARADA